MMKRSLYTLPAHMLVLSAALLLLALGAQAQDAAQGGFAPNGVILNETSVYAAPDFLANQPTEETIPANAGVVVAARNPASSWFFVRYASAEVSIEGWVPASNIRVNIAAPNGVANGIVIDPTPETYLRPNGNPGSLITRPTYIVQTGDPVVISSRDAAATWYFIRRPDGRYNWICANDVRITNNDVNAVPIWTVSTDPTPCFADEQNPPPPPTPGTQTGTALQATNVLTRILSGAPVIVGNLVAGQQVQVLAYTDTTQRYYLVQLPGGTLGWVDASRVSVQMLPPEI